MEMTPGEKIGVLENELKHLRQDHEEIKVITLANQKTLRWVMFVAATACASAPVVGPKVAKAIGAVIGIG